jgi:hypothetical protein
VRGVAPQTRIRVIGKSHRNFDLTQQIHHLPVVLLRPARNTLSLCQSLFGIGTIQAIHSNRSTIVWSDPITYHRHFRSGIGSIVSIT